MTVDYDVIVVGGSFAGLSAAMQLARARRRVLVLDGGKPRNRYAQHSHGFFGQDGKTPAEILTEVRKQLLAYPTVRLIDGYAQNAAAQGDHVVFTLADGSRHVGARVILATGIRDELPALAGVEERWGISVLHCPYCHGYEVAGRALGVLATSPMSLHQAMLIPDWGPTTWFTQGIVEPSPEEAAALEARGVHIERAPVVEILGKSPAITGLRLKDGRNVAVDALFVGTRTHLASDLAQQLGCALDDGPLGPVVRVDDWGHTTVRGVFAAGDMSVLMTNATFASASGVKAGVAAHRSLIFND
ncbi:NAD(P)/FAD-dependent oxidoreductase [Bordetella sp. N]|uniref:NAD(P)/FAD-dependent oxidoreductase n=1 Tax=Bordetella sp. N TaxID=1746199 RepID=UPI00070B0FB4|nr:NAD(P)/FAD-dependent oxidoreductase [Bordetella sp. N]ALM86752.1 thioredoxin reductase [Bordetella sp. N]